jgi:DNA-binding transcriptional LysR family regulator
MTIDLRRLRHLLALADHGSFGRAAAALAMTQPALSRSMQGLEQQVGAALFERSKSGVVPTDEGRVLILRARILVHAADELDRDVLARKVPGAGYISLGAGPYPGETIVPAALSRFVAAHPMIRVRVLVRGDWDELLRRLRAREVEFLVCEISTLDGEHDLDIEPLPPHPMYCIVRRRHPLTRRAVVRLVHTFAYPLVAVSRIPPRILQPMLATLPELDSLRPVRPFPAIELASLAAVKRLVANSDAIAPLPLPCVADELEHGTLGLLVTESWLTTSYGIVTLKGQPLSAAAGTLAELMREAEAVLTRVEAALIARYAPAEKTSSRQRRRNTQ